MEALEKAILYAKLRNVKVYLTLNILINNTEIDEAIDLVSHAYSFGVDGIIVQDLGIAKTLISLFPDLPIHASTQMTTYNLDGVNQLEKLGFKRVVLARELTINEINNICKNTSLDIEVFIHGALCVCYSGQCLMSSLIGTRSGNRGKCAQPCRLPYTLLADDKEKTTGYLLSPKDICAIDLIPKLIEAGVKSFKIEGRMKSPEYVGIVTKIYRKYIDLALSNTKYEVDENDRTSLMQAFNRGGFSTGYLNGSLGKNMMFYKKPNHMGLYLGKISNFNPNKGHIKIELQTPISVGDGIQINGESYTVSEVMDKNRNLSTTYAGQIVTLGRVKGNIKVGNDVYKISSKALNKSIQDTFSKENVKRKLNCSISICENTPISIKVYDDFVSIDYVSNFIPQEATNVAITEDRIISQMKKTGNTPFEFENIEINLGNNLSIPISNINELRRTALEMFENEFKKYISHDYTKLKSIEENLGLSKSQNTSKTVSVLLNNLNTSFEYSGLKNIDNIYIPFKFFVKPDYKSTITSLSSLDNCNLYVYLPNISKGNYLKLLKNNLENIINDFNLAGVVISNISQLELVENINTNIIGNYTLNVFNSLSAKVLDDFKFSKITLSPELNANLVNNFNTASKKEFIVYGNLPLMTSQYCSIGSIAGNAPHCQSTPCKSSKYYLKDRLRI